MRRCNGRDNDGKILANSLHATHTHANHHTKIARRLIAGLSYADSITLYRTYSERIPRDLPRTWSIYKSRSLRVLLHPGSRRETNGSLSTKVCVTIILDASVACLRSLEIHENLKLRSKPWRNRNTKWRRPGFHLSIHQNSNNSHL